MKAQAALVFHFPDVLIFYFSGVYPFWHNDSKILFTGQFSPAVPKRMPFFPLMSALKANDGPFMNSCESIVNYHKYH